jgi:hypothetical protein
MYFLGALPYSSHVLLRVTRILNPLTFLYAVNVRHFKHEPHSKLHQPGAKKGYVKKCQKIPLRTMQLPNSEVEEKHNLSETFIVFGPSTIRDTQSPCRNDPV